jgi:alkanesulfonate monooxygenase SsuD/methylene tetrahydromethanopterin reductase-like flavin-dependent oxidoreductase (luciferase family)
MPLSVVERWTLYGGEEDVARKLLDYRSAGVDEFLLLPASADPLGQYSRLRRVRELVEG